MSDFKPKISVIIPTYNRADLLRRAMGSVLAQTYQDWEIIVVDDASEEDIGAVIEDFADSRIRYYRHAQNQGGSAARNTGIKQAQGWYVAFLDSDDTWYPDKLKLQYQAISDYNPGCTKVVCYSQLKLTTTAIFRPAVLPARGKLPHEQVADYLWLERGEMITSTLVVSRTLALSTLFIPGLPKHQDLDFVLRLEQQQAEFIFVPQPLAVWHNEPRTDRVSLLKGDLKSLDWIEGYRGKISERAYRGFLLKEVIPKMLMSDRTKAEGVQLLIEGWRDRIIPFDYFIFLFIKQIFPRQYQLKLKKLILKFRN